MRILVPGELAKGLSRDQRDKVLKELRTKKELKLDGLQRLFETAIGARIARQPQLIAAVEPCMGWFSR